MIYQIFTPEFEQKVKNNKNICSESDFCNSIMAHIIINNNIEGKKELEELLSKYPDGKKKGIIERLQTLEDEKFYSCLGELKIHDILYNEFGDFLEVEKDIGNNKTPDFFIEKENICFEVYTPRNRLDFDGQQKEIIKILQHIKKGEGFEIAIHKIKIKEKKDGNNQQGGNINHKEIKNRFEKLLGEIKESNDEKKTSIRFSEDFDECYIEISIGEKNTSIKNNVPLHVPCSIYVDGYVEEISEKMIKELNEKMKKYNISNISFFIVICNRNPLLGYEEIKDIFHNIRKYKSFDKYNSLAGILLIRNVENHDKYYFLKYPKYNQLDEQLQRKIEKAFKIVILESV